LGLVKGADEIFSCQRLILGLACVHERRREGGREGEEGEPVGVSIPVFPPMEESTMAKRLVGI